jgi:uncharacterized protein (TIGR00730 family)
MNMTSLGVFCSATGGLEPSLYAHASDIVKLMAHYQMRLVYGGAKNGLMGHFADSMLATQGEVLGVIPEVLVGMEVRHPGLTENRVVRDLMDRKRMMMVESDAFLIFAGGIGTLDEALEVLTWKLLMKCTKPIYFYNHNGHWNTFFVMLRDLSERKVVSPHVFELYEVVEDVEQLRTILERDFGI